MQKKAHSGYYYSALMFKQPFTILDVGNKYSNSLYKKKHKAEYNRNT